MQSPRSTVRSSRLLSLVLATLVATAFALVPAFGASASTANGIADSTWSTNGSMFATVRYGNDLIIGGDFTTLRSTPGVPGGTTVQVNNLAMVDLSTGAAVTSFHPAVLEQNFTPTKKALVRSLALVGNTLYVGGQFTSINGQSHYNIAAMDLDPTLLTGSVDSTFNATVGVPGASNENTFFVYSIVPGTGGLFIGGAFTRVNGKAGHQKVAKLNWDGSVNTAFKAGAINGAVRAITWSSDGQTLFVAGAFSTFGGAAHQSIVRISPTTGALDAWQIPAGQVPIGGPSAPHYGMICWSLVATSTRLFAGCGETPNYDAAFRLDNGNSGDRTWLFGTSGNDQAIALSQDGQSLYFGGHFGTYLTMSVCSGKYLKNLGILHNLYGFSTPTLDCNFLPQFWGPDPFGGVWTIQLIGSQVWAGGMFTMANCTMGPAHPGQPAAIGCPNGVAQRGIVRFSPPPV